jgi:hypothetical protein
MLVGRISHVELDVFDPVHLSDLTHISVDVKAQHCKDIEHDGQIYAVFMDVVARNETIVADFLVKVRTPDNF